MCSDPQKFEIPTLTIIHKDGRTTCEPKLLTDGHGRSVVTAMNVEFGEFGEPVRVRAELLPSSTLLRLKTPLLALSLNGQQISKIILADGSEISFTP